MVERSDRRRCRGVPFDLTVPGGELPTAGVTVVGVLPTHRRRGVLRSLMRAQLDDAHERGEPLAALWASEESIYGRFGYGLASFCGEITLAHEYTSFAQSVRTARDLAADRARRGAGGDPAGLRAHPARVARHVLAEQMPGGRTARSPIPRSGVTVPARSAGLSTNATGRSRATPPTGTSRASKTGLRRMRSCESSRLWARRRKRYAISGRTCLRSTGSRPSSLICCRPTIHSSSCSRPPARMRYRTGRRNLGPARRCRRGPLGEDLLGRRLDRLRGRRRVLPVERGTLEARGRRPRRTQRGPPTSLCPCSRSAPRCSAESRSPRSSARGRVDELKDGAIARADALFRWDRHPWCPEIF